MENLEQYTPIELLKILNDVKSEHDKLKIEILDNTNQVDMLDKKINDDLILLGELEKNYIELIEEINNR